jgi:predicted Zn-dependent protease
MLEIENAKQNAENLQKAYEEEKRIYLNDGAQFTIDSDIFKTKYKASEDRVLEYNAKGGAPKEVYDAMTLELSELKKEAAALEERRKILLATMDTINAKVRKYNEFVVYTNNLIRKSNAIGAKKFTEGRFVPLTNTIDIYQFNDRTKLRRVITHELGHVLGINHNTNVQAIMYSVNSGNSTSLTKEDIADLKEVCK